VLAKEKDDIYLGIKEAILLRHYRSLISSREELKEIKMLL
jgi:hypothetical protein